MPVGPNDPHRRHDFVTQHDVSSTGVSFRPTPFDQTGPLEDVQMVREEVHRLADQSSQLGRSPIASPEVVDYRQSVRVSERRMHLCPFHQIHTSDTIDSKHLDQVERHDSRQNAVVLIPKRYWDPIRRGEVTLAFRRWKRQGVIAGRTYRTAAGRLHVESVDVVDPLRITDTDAVAAGHADPDSVRAELRGETGDPTYRITFRHLDEPDPRTELANDPNLSPAAVQEISHRLNRLDKASKHGPWTMETLELIEAHPERRAPDLAAMLERETQPFKMDVGKLKNLGLTVSFRIGYRLSPRGASFLATIRSSH